MSRLGKSDVCLDFAARLRIQKDEEELRNILKNWDAEIGDCRQELIFIGQNIDFQRLTSELDTYLLNDAEMADGSEAWQRLPDPFGAWQEAVA